MNRIVLLVMLAFWLSPILAAQTGPNVVIIFVDDQGCLAWPISEFTRKTRVFSAIVDEFELRLIGLN